MNIKTHKLAKLLKLVKPMRIKRISLTLPKGSKQESNLKDVKTTKEKSRGDVDSNMKSSQDEIKFRKMQKPR